MSSDVRATWTWSRETIERHQLDRLNALIRQVRKRPFYRKRLADLDSPLSSLADLARLPVLTKRDLVADTAGQPGRIFDLPRSSYSRLHQTSGTHGFAMPVLDTADDWNWWVRCWDHVLAAADVTSDDVAMMAFSFGPFIGFWTANDALIRRGAMVIPGGGMSSQQRLQMIGDYRCTIVCCTPTYALHLAKAAAESGIDLSGSDVRRVIVAGEPGGSIAAVRQRIEQAWGAKVIDHAGASELGAWAFGSADGSGLHVIETEFIAERLSFDDDHPEGVPVGEGETAELARPRTRLQVARSSVGSLSAHLRDRSAGRGGARCRSRPATLRPPMGEVGMCVTAPDAFTTSRT